MKVFPAVVLVLLAFATFFMTFLVAPLAVLTIFYIAYSLRARTQDKTAPQPPADAPRHEWGAAPDAEPDPEAETVAPAGRRPRVTVESYRERDAALAEAATGDADNDDDEAATPTGTATATAENDQ